MRIMSGEIKTVIGLMSGTSMDGIDVAVLETDGDEHNKLLFSKTYDYPDALIAKLKPLMGKRDTDALVLKDIEEEITRAHADACEAALKKFPRVSLIGFHGQTIWHAPDEGLTCQLGDGQLLADLTGRHVVNDFRSADMEAGGQGAPLLPFYHYKRSKTLPRPLVVVNIGGVSNVTYVASDIQESIGFDTGPGNALINDWMCLKTKTVMDKDAGYAKRGVVDRSWIMDQIKHPYFLKEPPKSLDRDAFDFKNKVDDWSIPDGAATLTYFTAVSIALSLRYLPKQPMMMVVSGGGRRNPKIMEGLKSLLPDMTVTKTETIGWNGDALEAEGFAYFAMCHVNKTPITYPNLTGCDEATVCGVSYMPSDQSS